MADRELKQLRLGTRDADRTPFSPLDPITFIEEGIQIVQNPGASSEYFVISDSKASSSISSSQPNPSIVDSDEDIVTLKASGRDFRFEATHIHQVDSILAYLVKMKDKASKRRTSREAVGVTDQVQALLDAIPKAFSHLKPQALAVFCDWVTTNKYSTMFDTSQNQNKYDLKLQATCVVLGNTLRAPAFVQLARKEICYAFIESKNATVKLTTNDVQICHAASPLLDSVLAELLNTYNQNHHPALEALLESHNHVHPKSWKAIEVHGHDDVLEEKAAVDPDEATFSHNGESVKATKVLQRSYFADFRYYPEDKVMLYDDPDDQSPSRASHAATEAEAEEIWKNRDSLRRERKNFFFAGPHAHTIIGVVKKAPPDPNWIFVKRKVVGAKTYARMKHDKRRLIRKGQSMAHSHEAKA